MPDRAMTDATDWGRLFHAYGVAEDTPGQLRHLVVDDAALRAAAIEHLHAAVLHQGTIYPATPAAVRWVIGLLGDPVLRIPLDRGESTLAALLGFLGCVAESIASAGAIDAGPLPREEDVAELFRQLRADETGEAGEEGTGWDSPLMGELMGHAVLALREMAGQVLATALPLLSDAAADIRREAMNVAAQWGALRQDDPRTRATADVLRHRLETCEGRDERAGLVVSLGKLGGDVSRWLDDPDEAVRACAALHVRGERADAELVEALTRPAQADAWFRHRPAAFPLHAHFVLLAELVARKPRLEDVLPAALVLIAQSGAMLGADLEWGPILRLAFPDSAAAFRPGVLPPLPARLSEAQRAVLQALVANLALWDPRSGNASLARKRVGLPDGREEVVKYLREAGR